jgi:hypothetical protein
LTHATSYQVGGTHYQNLGVQPIEFAMANKWDSGAFSVLKYLTRHRSKNGVEDLRKASHFVELRLNFIEHADVPLQVLPMSRYIHANGIGDTSVDATALMTLEAWVHGRVGAYTLTGIIDLLIKEYEA